MMNLQGLSQNWCLLSLDRLVILSIGIPTKCIYSAVHYLSKKHPQMSIHQIDLEFTTGFVKTVVCTPPKKERKKWKKTKFIHSHHPHFLRLYIWHFLKIPTFAAKHDSIFSIHFFMVVSNSSLGMRPKIVWVFWITSATEFLTPHFTFNRRKQPKFGKPFSTERSFPLSIYNIIWCKRTLHCNVTDNSTLTAVM